MCDAEQMNPDPLAYQDLVIQVARRYVKYRIDLDDLIGEGQIGLMFACQHYQRDHFDPVSFRVFARRRIAWSIQISLTRYLRGVHVPYVDYQLFCRVEKNEIDSSMLTEKQKEKLADIKYFLRKRYESYRIKENDEEDDDDIINNLSYKSDCDEESREKSVSEVLELLTDKEAKVVCARNGIDGHPVETFARIGVQIGLGKERTRSLYAGALAKIRQHFGISETQAIPGIPRKVGDPGRRYTGVYYNPILKKNPWKASIYIDGKLRYVGNYPSDREAAEAYDQEARRLGRPVNFPGPGEEQAIVGRCGGRIGQKLRRKESI